MVATATTVITRIAIVAIVTKNVMVVLFQITIIATSAFVIAIAVIAVEEAFIPVISIPFLAT